MLIQPDDYRFTFAEMLEGRENAQFAMSVRNWMARDVVKIGQKHKLGRWLFSVTDRLRIKFIDKVIRVTGMTPADANKYADVVIDRFLQLSGRDDQGKYRIVEDLTIGDDIGRLRLFLTAGPYGPSPILAKVGEQGRNIALDVGPQKEILRYLNDVLARIDREIHVMVPVDEMIGSVYMRCTQDFYEEDGGEWPMLNIGTPEPDDDDELAVHMEAQLGLDGMIAWFMHFGGEDADSARVPHG